MILKKLFKGIDYHLIKGHMDEEILGISYNSMEVKDGFLFVALIGFNDDGHKYIEDAIRNGAKAILVSSEVDTNVTTIKVNDTRKVLAKISMNWFNNPQDKLIKIGITGTKGKTTTSFMIRDILEKSGRKCVLIGTTGVYINDKKYPLVNTTPESYEIIKYMDEAVKNGIKYLVMEVSSQSLKYDRVNDIIFDYGIFTNLTKDHIGDSEHSDMDDYIKSKAKLFRQSKIGILNIDDIHYKDMINDNLLVYSYGYGNANLMGDNLKLVNDKKIGITFETKGLICDNFVVSLPGKFSSYNAMAAILTCYLLGIDVDIIKKVLGNFHVIGRNEVINIGNANLIIDYAHNGVSTESILKAIREYHPKRIVTIFGCGGNRSQVRRYEMGEAAGKYSDLCIITEDNNRYEKFKDILMDILVGINKTDCEYIVIPDRKMAIKYAIDNKLPGDIIMLLGKGHENYIEIGGKRYHFDEREVIKEILK